MTLQSLLGVIFFHQWKLPIQFGPWLKDFAVGSTQADLSVSILGVSNYLANRMKVEDAMKEYALVPEWIEKLQLKGNPSSWFDEKARHEIKRALNALNAPY